MHLLRALAAVNSTVYLQPSTATVNNATLFNISIYDPEYSTSKNISVQDLVELDAASAHFRWISPDGTGFINVRPEDFRNQTKTNLYLNVTFPQPGTWLMGVDYAFANGTMNKRDHVDFTVNNYVGPFNVTSAPQISPSMIPISGRSNVSFFGIPNLDPKYPDSYTSFINTTDLMSASPDAPSTTDERYIIYLDSLRTNGTPWILPTGKCNLISLSFYQQLGDSIPVTDLRGYMDSPASLILMDENRTTLTHLHTMIAPTNGTSEQDILTKLCDEEEHIHSLVDQVPSNFGPNILAAVTLPKEGRYRLYVEAARDMGTEGGVKVNDVLLTTQFLLIGRQMNDTDNSTVPATSSMRVTTGTMSATATLTATTITRTATTAFVTSTTLAPTQTSDPIPVPPPASSGMSGGAIAGITLTVLAAAGLGGFVYYNRNERLKRQRQWESQGMVEGGLRNAPKESRGAPYVELFELDGDDDDDFSPVR